MFLRGLLQLQSAMFQTAFGQQIDDLTATCANPIHGLLAIDEAEHLYLMKQPVGLGKTANHSYRLLLSFGHTG